MCSFLTTTRRAHHHSTSACSSRPTFKPGTKDDSSTPHHHHRDCPKSRRTATNYIPSSIRPRRRDRLVSGATPSTLCSTPSHLRRRRNTAPSPPGHPCAPRSQTNPFHLTPRRGSLVFTHTTVNPSSCIRYRFTFTSPARLLGGGCSGHGPAFRPGQTGLPARSPAEETSSVLH